MSDATFEDVDKAVRAADLTPFQAGGVSRFSAADAQTSPADVLASVCGIYRMVRPILSFVKRILPKSWRTVVETFMDLMDGLCPGS